MVEIVDIFSKIGLDKTTITNPKLTNNVIEVINEAGVSLSDGCDRSIGNLLFAVATEFPNNADIVHRRMLLNYISSNKINTRAQLGAAFTFLSATGLENRVDIVKFEEACGVGVEVLVEDIERTIDDIFKEKNSVIIEQRYRIARKLFADVIKKLPWANPKIVKDRLDSKLYTFLGLKTAADIDKPVKKKKEEKLAKSVTAAVTEEVPDPDPFLTFPAPHENFKVHTTVSYSNKTVLIARNSLEILKKHLETTGGKVVTRFPPEPNGYLHLGHAKAMFVDFGLAKHRAGDCYLRLDDTNPEAEKKEYTDHIIEDIAWMGWEPSKTTHTSDHFDALFDMAVVLICGGHAYVDQLTGDEIKEYRERKMDSPFRNRPVEESLKLFNEMKCGLIEEGKATLRMKQDMQNDNFNMYDLIAYRIKFTPHPRTGDKWKIYPSYDFAHCIVDSLENITHSLCTLEFETRRASYYWLLDALKLYQPHVWEYSRLNITNTVMSKRKLNRLVTEKYVDGWDDPRLMTLAGLRRRGVTPTSINAFIRGLGITRSDGSMIPLNRLEYHIREELNKTASRAMVVLHPLKVVITNLEPNTVIDLDAKRWPDTPDDGASAYYKVPFSSVVYIEESDFRMEDSKDFYGLAPGKTVLLRYAYPIKCTEVKYSDDKKMIVEILAEYDPLKKSKPKGVLHWVAEPSPGVDPLKVEVRLFNKLFLSENPGELDNWLDDLNPESKVVIRDAYAVPSLKHAEVCDKFQFERLGYFVADKESTHEKRIFNRTVTLRDNYDKAGK